MAESPSNGGDDLLFRLSIDEDGQQANSPRMPPALHIESPNERESTKPLVRWEEVDERVDETKLLAQAELREQLAASMPESVPIIPPAGTNKDYDVEIIETSSPVENPSIDAGQSEKKSDVPEKSKQSKVSFFRISLQRLCFTACSLFLISCLYPTSSCSQLLVVARTGRSFRFGRKLQGKSTP